ncbi:restriction endonuclease subunit S [Chryseobacterium sp. RLHN22]|uniref:restriction endonuclease subunit S n=1 Tax=Chryseobacterium sp. RLHN22 TaxID=3437885 RepID=UPI003D9B7A3C
MTFDSYYNLKITLPEIKIQKKIANILQAIDNKIDLNNQINDNLPVCLHFDYLSAAIFLDVNP